MPQQLFPDGVEYDDGKLWWVCLTGHVIGCGSLFQAHLPLSVKWLKMWSRFFAGLQVSEYGCVDALSMVEGMCSKGCLHNGVCVCVYVR